jgi:DNA-binding NtrC family response regulator
MSERPKILIVDDQEVVRLSYLRSLAGTHCDVQVATNGEEALHAMERHGFDLVLLDLRMPGVDGMTVLKTIKQNWPETEVVIITGYPNVETAKEAVRLGAYGYLAKPVGPEDVINAANDAMIQKRWTLHEDRAVRNTDTGSGRERGAQ